MSVSTLAGHVERSILERRLFRRGQGILIGVSGGLDSMVLLAVLAELAGRHGWKLTAAHFNHRLRGQSSDADERLVARMAKRLGIGFVRGEGNVREYARRKKMSLEMAGRELRHEFFAREASRLNFPSVALAHHADDQVELFFLRLLRGAGAEGLAGMKWLNASPQNPRLELARPLLDLDKEALRAHARERRVAYREDATNAQLDILRNRLRHELLPLLEKVYQPALRKVILRQMDLLGAEAEVVTELAKGWLGEEGKEPPLAGPLPHFVAARRKKTEAAARQHRPTGGGQKTKAAGQRRPAHEIEFKALPVAVQRRCLYLQAAELGLTANFELIELWRREPGRVAEVREGLWVSRDEGGRLWEKTASEGGGFGNINSVAVDLTGGRGALTFDGVRLDWKLLPAESGIFHAPKQGLNCEIMDADKVGGQIELRHWRPGDRFQPIGMADACKLQDLFTNQKVLRQERHRLIVGATAGGEIFWVEGLRLGERFKLEKKTRRRLKWRWNRL